MRQCTVTYAPLRSCLVSLPPSLSSQLSTTAPETVIVDLGVLASNGQLVTVHAGWSGRTSRTPDSVEIDPTFAGFILGPDVALRERDSVSVHARRDARTASSVSVTPLSSDDWEILETNASFVEANLLFQVRTAKVGAIIGCWIRGGTLVKFAVDSVSPQSSTALRLDVDTELVVAPKTRASEALVKATHDVAAAAATGEHGEPDARSDAWSTLSRTLLRLLPLEHGVARQEGEGSKGDAHQDEQLHQQRTVLVSAATFASVRMAAPSLRIALAVISRRGGGGAAAGGSSSRAAPSGGQHHGGEEGSSKSSTDAQGAEDGKDARDQAQQLDQADVRVAVDRSVPAGHVWASAPIRRSLGLDASSSPRWGTFELVRFVPRAPAAPQREQTSQKSSRDDAAESEPQQRRRRQGKQQTEAKLHTASTETLPLAPLAGVSELIVRGVRHVERALAARRLGNAATPTVAEGLLLAGASGSGKTGVAEHVLESSRSSPESLTHIAAIDGAKLADERLPPLKSKLRDWVDDACWHAPAILFVDNIDRLFPAEVEHVDPFPTLQMTRAFLSIVLPALLAYPIVLVATTQSTSSMHSLLSSSHLFGETLALKSPNKSARRDIVDMLVQTKLKASPALTSTVNPAAISTLTEGYLPADLRDLVDRAIHQAAIRGEEDALRLTDDDFKQAQTGFVPLSLREVKLQKAEVQWSDIGGLHETRRVLRETLEWPTKYGPIFANCPLRLRSGLLLYGFPGCGKTLLASAVANECGLNFISVKGPEILNKYIGASEKSVRDLFERAQSAKPCVLFFDEFESIAPKRGHDSTGVTDRVVNQMLTQMDGAEGLDGVYVLAATSRPDLIDPALLRPGRLDKSLLCGMPDQEERLDILRACSKKVSLASDVDLNQLAAKTNGFSGADLQALVYNANLDAIQETLPNLAADENGSTDADDVAFVRLDQSDESKPAQTRAEQGAVNKRLQTILESIQSSEAPRQRKTDEPVITLVHGTHLTQSLESMRPSVPRDEAARLQRIYAEFVTGRSAAGLPSGEASDQIGGRTSLM